MRIDRGRLGISLGIRRIVGLLKLVRVWGLRDDFLSRGFGIMLVSVVPQTIIKVNKLSLVMDGSTKSSTTYLGVLGGA